MGLELLDVSMEIEESFGLQMEPGDFWSEDQLHIVTAGDLYECVLTKLQKRDQARNDLAINRQFWLSMQLVLHTATDIPQHEIQLCTPLQQLFPAAVRRERWNAVAAVCPWQLPALNYSPIVSFLGLSLSVAMVAFEQFQIWQIPGVNWLWPLLGLAGLWMFVETYAKLMSMFDFLKTCFPARLITVKDLCRAMFAANYRKICEQTRTSLAADNGRVWDRLALILEQVSGIDRANISFRSRLVQDLGLG